MTKQSKETINDNIYMPFADHLDALRRVALRCLLLITLLSVIAFCFKDEVFRLVTAPLSPNFVTFTILREALSKIGMTFSETGMPELIATEISSQFMAHISMSVYTGVLLASPYIVYSIMGFLLPALYDNERRYASRLCLSVYVLFVAGLLLSYFIMFPVSCRFLATYSVSTLVTTMVDLSSYIGLFVSLSLAMAVVFQLPVVIWFLTKAGIVKAEYLRAYRKHCFVGILVISAFITPPDAMSMILVAMPLYLLYEISIIISSRLGNKINNHGTGKNISVI